MRTKTMVGIAVASALSWSYGAMANTARGNMDAESTYGVVTPFSPNESGPAAVPHGNRYSSIAQGDQRSAGGPIEQEVVTPLASHEAGPNDLMLQRRGHRFERTASRSMANPQTPWSPSEAGMNTFNEDMRGHARQVAEVEHARVAAAEWNANLAARSTELDTRASLSDTAGGTSGVSLQGSNERYVDPPLSSMNEPARQSSVRTEPDVRGDASMPSEVDRTSAMRPEAEYALPVTEYNTVGILETPTEPSEYTVWSVEPLNPGADIATGDTVYVVPAGAELVFVPDFGSSSTLGASGEQSASVTDDARDSSESSPL